MRRAVIPSPNGRRWPAGADEAAGGAWLPTLEVGCGIALRAALTPTLSRRREREQSASLALSGFRGTASGAGGRMSLPQAEVDG